MHDHVNTDVDTRWWPTFRPRRHVKARRVGEPFDFGGRFYDDGYVMRGSDGVIVVLSVREFEAVYEPAGRDE